MASEGARSVLHSERKSGWHCLMVRLVRKMPGMPPLMYCMTACGSSIPGACVEVHTLSTELE